MRQEFVCAALAFPLLLSPFCSCDDSEQIVGRVVWCKAEALSEYGVVSG
jgi:hypothetical protein